MKRYQTKLKPNFKEMMKGSYTKPNQTVKLEKKKDIDKYK